MNVRPAAETLSAVQPSITLFPDFAGVGGLTHLAGSATGSGRSPREATTGPIGCLGSAMQCSPPGSRRRHHSHGRGGGLRFVRYLRLRLARGGSRQPLLYAFDLLELDGRDLATETMGGPLGGSGAGAVLGRRGRRPLVTGKPPAPCRGRMLGRGSGSTATIVSGVARVGGSMGRQPQRQCPDGNGCHAPKAASRTLRVHAGFGDYFRFAQQKGKTRRCVNRRAILTPRIASCANVTLMAPSVLTIRRRSIGWASRLSRLARREGLWAGRAIDSPSRPQARATGRRSSRRQAVHEQRVFRQPSS